MASNQTREGDSLETGERFPRTSPTSACTFNNSDFQREASLVKSRVQSDKWAIVRSPDAAWALGSHHRGQWGGANLAHLPGFALPGPDLGPKL